MEVLRLGRRRKLRLCGKANSEEFGKLREQANSEADLFQVYQERVFRFLHSELVSVWDELSKPQQVVGCLGVLVAQVSNGGIWQFLYNKSHLSVAVGESLDALGTLALPRYQVVLQQYAALVSDDDFLRLLERSQDPSRAEDERWNDFKTAGEKLTEAEAFDKGFFEGKTRERFFSRLNRYVEQNLDKLIEVESKAPASTPVKKKEAIAYFGSYLQKVYQAEPAEVSLYYTGRVTIEDQPAQLFLMKFRMSDGFEGIGVTGHFTSHLPDVSFKEVQRMHQKHHKQKLVNLFYGAYLADKARAENPKAQTMEPGLWESFLKKIQDPSESQIPVNVTFLEYFKMEGCEVVIYSGDLLYNPNLNSLPADLNNLDVEKMAGEPNKIFKADPRGRGVGGRGSATEPVESKYPLAAFLGRKFKLLKDNPWGF